MPTVLLSLTPSSSPSSYLPHLAQLSTFLPNTHSCACAHSLRSVECKLQWRTLAVISGSTLQRSAGMVHSHRTLVFSSTHLLTLKLLHQGLMTESLRGVCVCLH